MENLIWCKSKTVNIITFKKQIRQGKIVHLSKQVNKYIKVCIWRSAEKTGTY